MDHPTPLPQVGRRRALQLLGGAVAAAAVVGCASDDSGSASSSAGAGSSGSAAAGAIPEETAGPFPGDGTNGPDALGMDGIVRRDITPSLSGGGVADGVPLTVELTVLDAASGDPLPGAAVYAWHCDREGRYSMYSEGASEETYLRGVQAAADDGTLAFDTVFPGAYPGRWPHIHFEVYASADDATGGGSPIATSQLALPQDTCTAAYATSGYESSASTFTGTSISSDMVFSDGASQQTPTVSGEPSSGLTASLPVPV